MSTDEHQSSPSDAREPDHTDDPRETETGQGYGEEGQPGTSGGEHAAERGDTDAQKGGHDAPDTSSDEDGEPDQATGNRRDA